MNDGWLKSLLEKLPGSWQIDQGKALAFGHTAAADLPTCNASRENEHRYIRGAAGVADREVVCEKDAANAYAWQDKGAAALDGVYQPKDATLTALAAYNTNGLLAQTAADTFAGRTITGTANKVTVTQGDGVAGNPTLTLPDAITLVTPTVSGLAGTGTRVVEASSAGLLSASNRQAWVWLSEDTFTGVTEFIKDSILTTTYDEYEVVYTIDNLSTAAAGALFQWRAAGATKSGAVYYGGYAGGGNVGGATGALANGATSFSFAHAGGNLNRSISVTLKTYRPAVARAANEALTFHMITAQHRQGTDIRADIMGGGYLGTEAMDGFRISASAGNLVGGTARVYGRRKS